MPSPLEIITDAFRDLNLVGAGQTNPSAENTEWGLGHFNDIIEQLAANGLGWYDVNELFAFGTSKQSYTIGPAASGADFIMTAPGTRPPAFSRAKLVVTAAAPVSETVIPVIPVQVYSSVFNPAASSGTPSAIYYEASVPLGRLWPVPYPTTVANGLRLFWKVQLATVAIASINVNIDLPQAVRAALRWELFRRCLRGKPITAEQKLTCYRTWQVLVTMKNADPVLISTAIPGSGGGSINPNTLRSY